MTCRALVLTRRSDNYSRVFATESFVNVLQRVCEFGEIVEDETGGYPPRQPLIVQSQPESNMMLCTHTLALSTISPEVSSKTRTHGLGEQVGSYRHEQSRVLLVQVDLGIFTCSAGIKSSQKAT